MTPRIPNAISLRWRRSARPKHKAIIRHGWRSTISTGQRVACPHLSRSCPMSPRKPRASGWAPGVVTLTIEDPVRVAEDAAVTDALAGGRLEVGVGPGGTPSSFAAFGQDFGDQRSVYDAHLATLRWAWAGDVLAGDNRLYPAAVGLDQRVWQATFSAGGGIKTGQDGDGLLL